ncbi:MAG: tetratricopeptide (TPR) repeat protein [Verrucomicrobiales bacterium]
MWKKVLFSAVTTIVFFVGLELMLSLFGVRPLLYDDDPHVGFASNVPLFVDGKAGKFVTAPNKIRWFNPQQFPQEKAAKVRRVFCVGGSTTYGRPYSDATSFCGWLREYLPAADPAQRWEVINAGGISYASYRVAKVMEELIDYQPDLFVVYSGHNEFLEERTYQGVIQMPEAVRGLQAALGHTRTYSMMAGLLRKKPDSKKGGKSAQTPVLSEEVNTILDQSAGLERYARDAQLASKVIEHYRFNLARIVDIAQSVGAQVIFVTPAGNLGDSSPFKSQHTDGLTKAQLAQWKIDHDRAGEAYAGQRYAEALDAIDRALAIDPDFAHSRYLRAQVLEKMGEIDAARAAYTEALVADVCPLRILPVMRNALTQVAKSRNVPVFDYHAFLTARSEHGIPGDDWFLDHVHPTVEGHRLLALGIVSLMAKEGVLIDKSRLSDDSIAQIKQRVLAGIDEEAHGVALRNLGNVLNWAGKKQEAYTAVLKALELAPGDAYAHYLAGDLAGHLGKPAEAEERFRELTRFDLDPEDAPYYPDAHYQLAQIIVGKLPLVENGAEGVKLLTRALQLQTDHKGAKAALPLLLKSYGKQLLQSGNNKEAAAMFRQLEKSFPADRMAANLLGATLIQDQRYPEAIEVLTRAAAKDPGNPSIRNNLGTAYARNDQPNEAAEQFALATKYKPDHIGAHLNLARVLESLGERDQAAQRYSIVLKLQPGNTEAREGKKRNAGQTE